MTLTEKCKLWIKAAKADQEGILIISDETFDVLSYQLAKNYEKLPKWFKNHIPKENLETGSTLGLEKILSDIFGWL